MKQLVMWSYAGCRLQNSKAWDQDWELWKVLRNFWNQLMEASQKLHLQRGVEFAPYPSLLTNVSM